MSYRRSKMLPLGMILGTLLANPPAKAAEDEIPALELLDYLGQWEQEDGSWSDPMDDYAPQQYDDNSLTQTQPDAPNRGSERP